MKALILSGGGGTRLLPLTLSRPKQLLPIANKPVLFYIIESLIEAGLSDIGIIVNKGDYRIKSALGRNKWGIDFTFIEQASPKGLADAVRLSRPFIKNDKFLVWLGDTLIEEPIKHFIHAYTHNQCQSVVLLGQTTQPKRCGIAEIKDKRISRVVEKPDNPPSNLALAGAYIFDKDIFPSIENISPSNRGELEITDAIQDMIEQDIHVLPFETRSWWKDVGNIEDMLEANRYILNNMRGENNGRLDKNSKLHGNVMISQDTTIKQCTLIGPVLIGKGCKITGSILGPNTSIGDNGIINNVKIENSIIFNGFRINGTGEIIQNRVVGQDLQD